MEKFDIEDEDCFIKLYDSIFRRRSVRDYSFEDLPEEKLSEAKEIVQSLEALDPSVDLRFHLIKEGKPFLEQISGVIGNYGKVRAPHYLAVTGERKEGRFRGVGYIGEQIVLYLTNLDIGTCWIGKGVTDEILSRFIKLPEDHTFTALVAFGFPEGKEQLKKRNRWKRKELSDLIIDGKMDDLPSPWNRILEAARVAPSAANSQPWRFLVREDLLHLYTVKRNRLTNLVTGNLENMNRIDGGIALLHSQIAAKTLAKNGEVFISSEQEGKDLNYIGSLKIERE